MEGSMGSVLYMEKLGGIVKSVYQLRMTLGAGSGEAVDAALAQIGEITQGLQRTLCDQAIVENYKQEAIRQATRVAELVGECGSEPDERQFASIGYACDLAVARIREYQQMVNYAAQLRELELVAIKEC